MVETPHCGKIALAEGPETALSVVEAHPDWTVYVTFGVSNFAKDGLFNGAVCILATHHIGDNLKAFQEAYRVIKEGRFVIFTATPEQMRHYWLWHYFPNMMQGAASIMLFLLNCCLHNFL